MRPGHPSGVRLASYDATRTSLYRPGEASDFFASTRHWTAVPALCAELSRLSYCDDSQKRQESLAKVGLEERAFLDVGGTEVLIAVDATRAFVAFRGTDDLRALLRDLDLAPARWEKGGLVHEGFVKYLGKVRPFLMAVVSDLASMELTFTGHSLGAAAATLAESLWPHGNLCTFGSPRVGDDEFVRTIPGERAQRFVNCCDRVCRVPPLSLGYAEVGILRYIDRAGALATEPPEGMITADRRAGAWEHLLRYSWAFWRNVLFRGLADHSPVNYVAPLAESGGRLNEQVFDHARP